MSRMRPNSAMRLSWVSSLSFGVKGTVFQLPALLYHRSSSTPLVWA